MGTILVAARKQKQTMNITWRVNTEFFSSVFTYEKQFSSKGDSMNRKQVLPSSSRFAVAILAAVLAIVTPALAGPPLVCHPIDIGSAQSLAWTTNMGNLTGRSDYDLAHLTADTIALLSPSTPVLVRMETLRRATIYAQRDKEVAKRLLLTLKARTDANESDALAQFDYGYLIECYRQAQLSRSLGMTAWGRGEWSNPAAGVDGYTSVKKAIEIRGQDPEMEFAAALITFYSHKSDHQEHARKALAGAKEDSLLAKNVEENQILAIAAKDSN
jgi:hypothetical protein